MLLAGDLLDSDPQAASDLLDKAIGLDRYNEALYRKAMHALGDADGIRTLLRALTQGPGRPTRRTGRGDHRPGDSADRIPPGGLMACVYMRGQAAGRWRAACR